MAPSIHMLRIMRERDPSGFLDHCVIYSRLSRGERQL